MVNEKISCYRHQPSLAPSWSTVIAQTPCYIPCRDDKPHAWGTLGSCRLTTRTQSKRAFLRLNVYHRECGSWASIPRWTPFARAGIPDRPGPQQPKGALPEGDTPRRMMRPRLRTSRTVHFLTYALPKAARLLIPVHKLASPDGPLRTGSGR
jgi:hypothetical protein